jgi:hypothetical protein
MLRGWRDAMAKIWEELRFLFDTDDGSLPDVRLTELTGDGLAAGYAFLRSQAQVSPGMAFWHRSQDRVEQLDDWPNPAQLVAAEEADEFHFLARNFGVRDVILPDLGVFVFRHELALDYRMGPEWDEPRLLALFELLRRLAVLDSRARVRLGRGTLPAVEERFLTAWAEYCQGAVMTEKEWCYGTSPLPMLVHLRDAGGASERQLRLFAAACCQRGWDLLGGELNRRAVKVAERHADGLATDKELASARDGTGAWWRAGGTEDVLARTARGAAGYAAGHDPWRAAYDVASHMAWLISHGGAGVAGADGWKAREERKAAERGTQAGLLRDIVGNQFRPLPLLNPAWDGWVAKMAAAIYEERRFADLPILADALEDSGCNDTDLLSHLRGPGPHVRGCHAVDRVLGGGPERRG